MSIDFDQHFMLVAKLKAEKSPDPNTKVGSVIVKDYQIISTGFNEMPLGLNDSFTWDRTGIETKYPYVVHAEMNAILNTDRRLHNCIVYTTLFPCSECAKNLAQAGVKKVIYLSDKYHDTFDNKAAKKIFDVCGVEYEQLLEKE